MNAKDFVELFHNEKQDLLEKYFSKNSQTEVKKLITSLNLNDEQYRILLKVLDTSLTDAFYTILLGLDGAASIGGKQYLYDIRDEKGKQISSGDIEAYAYEYFHSK